MDKLILLVVLGAIVAVVSKYRMDAARSRKDTMKRITEDHQSRTTLSPTADLFREAGVPVPDELAAAEPTGAGTAPVVATPTTDLATIFEGISFPDGLIAAEGVDPHRMTMSSPDEPTTVASDLAAEVRKIGGVVEWQSEGHGEVANRGGRAVVTVESDPDGSGSTVRLRAI
jgi:hypothetical protein